MTRRKKELKLHFFVGGVCVCGVGGKRGLLYDSMLGPNMYKRPGGGLGGGFGGWGLFFIRNTMSLHKMIW